MSTKLPLSHFTTWLARGERGLSSEAIVENLTGERVTRFAGSYPYHPYDPGDFRRCVDLLDQHPLAKLVFPGTLAEKSPEWAALIDIWDELTALLREEQSENTGRCPRTYARMQEVLDAVRVG
jgi:hypothetical protein